MTGEAELRAAVEAWIADDPDPGDRAELQALLDRGFAAGLIPAVERYLEVVQRMAEMNRDLTVKWVQAASALSGVAWEQAPAESAGDVVRDPGAPARPGGSGRAG